ncbi:MAG: alpha/beta fold hydrolase [Deltaproteobacteria bacterium]|jgi:pimeloyl-ACP methyl ester carboxylesterase|nr:alpha/beta fold hydrolase [Deltaproteobacteria bacterium]MBW2532406.1 alpha/beta fold hydrolase [Deltaproteobacteria bacterium]
MSRHDLVVREQYVPTADGWNLHLKRTISPLHFDPTTQPLLIVPGYGMNSFIFGYHPKGTSMERCLAEGGYEVWSLNLRSMGHARPLRKRPGAVTLRAYSEVDVPAAIERVLERTQTTGGEVVTIGCSLGGTILYGYLALRPRDHGVSRVIAMGAPLRWIDTHALLRVLFASPRVAGTLRLSGTRRFARVVAPVLQQVPSLLSMYMNSASIDMAHLPEMTDTVEDPKPRINREISLWLRSGDLSYGDVNITEAVGRVDLPLLVVLSNRDGIVPETTALSVVDAWGGQDVEVLEVGDDEGWYAHANLFVADDAPERVFEPIIAWLRRPVG